MVTHRLFTFIYFTSQLKVLACYDDFFLLANSTCWPFMTLFFTGQLNVLACRDIARWMSSALITRLSTCSGNTS